MSQIPLQCEVCNQRFSGPVPAQQHFESQKHKKKTQNSLQQQFSNTYCQVCNISCDTIQILRNHEVSPRHLAMVEKRKQLAGGDQGYVTEVPSRVVNERPEAVNQGQGDKEYVFNGSRGYCYLCNLDLTSESHATSHLNGKNHAKKRHQKELKSGLMNGGEQFCSSRENLQMTSSEFCETCRVPFTGPENARQHYNSENHKKKARQNGQRSIEETFYRSVFQPAPSHSSNKIGHEPSLFDRDFKIHQENVVNTTLTNTSDKMCELCNVFLSGPDNALQHYASEKHKKKVSQLNLKQCAEALACDLCKVQFTSSDNKRDHMASSKHKKKVELRRREECGNLLPLCCKICDCTFTGQENAQAHFSSEKHKRNEHNTGIQLSKLMKVSGEASKPFLNVPNTSKKNQGLFVNLDKEVDKYVGQQPNSYSSHDSEEFSDTFLAKPLNDIESSDESYEENFVAKPVTDDDHVQQANSQPDDAAINIVNPADDSHLCNQMHRLNVNPVNDTENVHQETIANRQANNLFYEDFESIGERKIREETQTSLRPSLSEMLKSHAGGFNSAISDSGTVYDDGPPRVIQNNLQSGFLGRGRGLLKTSNSAAVKRPGEGILPSQRGEETIPDYKQQEGQYNCTPSRVNEDDETKLKRFLSNISVNEDRSYVDANELEEIEMLKEPRKFEQYQVLQYTAKSKAVDDGVGNIQKQNNTYLNAFTEHNVKVSELQREPTNHGTEINKEIRNDMDLNNVQMNKPLYGMCKTDWRASTDSNISSALSEGSGKGPDSGGSWKGSINQDEYRFSETSERGWCYVCSIELTSRNHMRQHTLGQKHMKARQMWRAGGAMSDLPGSAYRCDICNVMLSGPEPRDQHLKSQKHLKKLWQLETSGSDFYCDICKVQCSGDVSYQQHLVGSQHVKMCGGSHTANFTGFDRTQWFDCEVCKCRLNTRQQLEIHKKSPRHLAKAQKLQSFDTDVINHIIAQSDQMQGMDNMNFHRNNMEENYSSPSGQQSLLEKFLSEPLFPDEYTPDGSDNNTAIGKDSGSQAPIKTPIKPVVTDEPVPVFKRFATQSSEMSAGDQNCEATPNETGNTKRGGGSDLAFATRSRGTKASIQDSSLGDTKKGEENVNPFAKTHPYYCHTCRVPMNTQESYEDHVKGKRHIIKVSKEKAPDRQHLSSRKCSSNNIIPKTKTVPRNYQEELFRKSLTEDTLCFLPTGTGKTLVSVLTLCHMLEEFPSKNVLFLVDKVLLVLQQSKYIKEQIDGRHYVRYATDSEDYRELTRRPLNIASVCMGQQSTSGIPMWKHDIVVVTAAFCKNLLDQGILKWTDFSLVIFDEAHHCEKAHPFNILLQHYHSQVRIAEDRPKILGLTASPAGKSDLARTVEMLQKLLANMGRHVVMNIVEEKQNLETLQAIQSNAKMIVKVQQMNIDDTTNSNRELIRKLLLLYIVDCLNFLCHVSDIMLYLNLAWIESDTTRISFMEFEYNIDAVQASLGMLSSDKMEKVKFSLFTQHVQCMCMAYNSLLEGGIICALEEINSMETTDANFKFAKGIGLPCDELYTAFMNEGQNMLTGSGKGSDMSHKTGSHIQNLMKELITVNEGNHSTDRKSISLVLVKQRGTAHKLSTILNSSLEMQQRGLRTAMVVGHGGGGAPDKGMSVNQQKRTLEDIKQHLYQVIIATSVAEEGVDWPECDCVISMYPPSTVTALVQMRGRARKKDSKFIILCESEAEREKLEDIMRREKNMIEATKVIVGQQNST